MNVVIAGAGLSGLAAAISLRRCGHRVNIYERSSLNNEIGAAINVPPNVCRFLIPWGLDPVRARFVTSTGMFFLSHATLSEQAHHDHIRTPGIFGYPLYYAHRVDLHESLKQLATDPDGPGTPVKIHLKSEVASYHPEAGSITLADGRTVTGDLVVAADGVHTIAVEAIQGKPNPSQPALHLNCAYRFLIPSAEIEDDPVTKPFLHGPQRSTARVWVDPSGRRRLIGYPCRDYQIMNFALLCYNENMKSRREDWHAAVDKAELMDALAGFDPNLLAMTSKATEVKRWPLLYRPPIPTWHKGRLVATGDAAHPMLPHHGQGGAQGIEDGLALGLVMHGVTDPAQIEERLAVFEKVRYNRASTIQILSNYGFDEGATEELVQYLEGCPPPKSIQDMINIAYGHDVLESVKMHMTELDPTFKIPDGFFPCK